MELRNFGGVLTFAAEQEQADAELFEALAANPACADKKAALEDLAKQCRKNQKNLLRSRQENVTEMILEPISDFTSEPYETDKSGAGDLAAAEALAKAGEVMDKSIAFYNQAKDKISALPEVSRLLKKTGQRKAKAKDLLD